MGNSLIKDVPDPVVLSVSLTKQPCLHESKFCELSDNMEEELSLKSKILNAMGMSEEAEVIALKSEVSELKETIATMQNDFQEALKSMQEEFKQTLTEALTPVEETVEVVAEKAEEAEPTEEVEVEVEEEVAEKAEEVEEVVEEEPEVAEKGESKAEPVHDNIAEKTAKPVNIYTALGRNPDGTRKL
jgi:TolA-binding protein